MQEISAELEAAIRDDAQTIIPRVKVEWLNSRFVEDLQTLTTSDNYIKKTRELEPKVFWQFNEPDYAAKIQHDHPLANLWMLDDVTSTAADYNGLVDGTYTGGYTQSQDSIVSTASTLFNGSSGYVSIPGEIRYSPGYLFGYFTVEAWIYMPSVATSTIVGKGDVDATRTVDDGYEWKFGIDSDNLTFTIYEPDGTEYVSATGATTMTDATWHHVVATWDGKLIKLYLDGNFEAVERLDEGFQINMPKPNTSDVNIGRMPDATGYFPGNINAVAIYNTILNATEITGHYNIGIGRVYDYSTNANSGQWIWDETNALQKVQDENPLNRLLPASRYIPEFTGSEFALINNINGVEDFTVEIWANIDAHLGTGVTQTVVAKAAQGPTLVAQFGIDAIGVDGTHDRFQAYVYNDSGTKFSVDGASLTTLPGTWVHLMMMVQDGVLTFYQDGESQGTATITGSQSTSAYSLCVGRFGGTLTPQFFEGNIMGFVYYESVPFEALSAMVRYLSSIRQNASDLNFGPSLMTGDEVANGHYGYGHLWAVLGAKDSNGSRVGLSNKYDIAEDTTQDKTYKYEYGWWGNNASDNDGVFANSESIISTFNDIECNAIGIYLPEEYGRIQTYHIYYKSTSDVWTQVGGLWEVDQYEIIHMFSNTITIRGLYLEILSTELPEDYAKVSEVTPLILDDISDDVVALSIKKTKENYDSSVPFGATAANTLSLTLQNIDLRYNPNNSDSDIYGLMVPDTKFTVELGWEDAGGSLGLLCDGVDGNAASPNKPQFIPNADMEISANIFPDDITPVSNQTIVGVGTTGISVPLEPDNWEGLTVPSGFDRIGEYPQVTMYGTDILVGGGWGNARNEKFWMFDPSDDSFTPIADAPYRRQGTASTHGGVAYCWFDNELVGTTSLKRAAKYNGSWTTLSNPPERMYASVTLGSYIYTMDFSDIYRYDPSGDSYLLQDSFPDPSYTAPFGSQADVPQLVEDGGKIYGIGAFTNGSELRYYVYEYIPGSGWGSASTYQVHGGYNSFIFAYTATAVEGKIYVMSGWGPVDELYIYDIATDTWSSGATLPYPTASGHAISDGNDIYLMGLYNDTASNYGYALRLNFTGGSTPEDLSWRLTLLTDGKLRFSYSDDGTSETNLDSTVSLSGLLTTGYIKVTMDVGVSNTTVKFWYSLDGDSWTQLGSNVLAGEVVNLWDSGADLQVGSLDYGVTDVFDGIIYSVQLCDGIDGLIIANPNFVSDPLNVDVSTFTDSLGNTWTVHSGASLIPGGIEYVEQGVFYADTFQTDSSGMINNISCRDHSKFMQETTKDVGMVMSNSTAAEAIERVAKEAGVLNKNIDVDIPYSKEIIKSAPVSYWDFSQLGFDNWAFNFNGSTRASSSRLFYMNRSSKIDNDVVLPFVVEFWMYTNDTSGTIFNYATSGEVNKFNIKLNSGEIRYTSNGSDSANIGISVDDEYWHHIAAVVSATEVRTFVDGQDVGTVSLTTTDIGGTVGYITLGDRISTWPATFASDFYTGYLTDVRIWASTYEDILEKLTVSASKDAASTYGKEYNTLAFFAFEEGSGTTIASSKDYFNVLEVSGTAVWEQIGVNTLKDKAGIHHATVDYMSDFNQDSPITSENSKSYRFDNDVAHAPHSSDFDFTDEMSFEVWTYVTSVSSSRSPFIAKLHPYQSLATDTWEIGLRSSSRLIYVGQQPDTVTVSSVGSVDLNEWTHIVVSIGVEDGDSVPTAKFYINGELDSSAELPGNFVPNTEQVTIGGGYYGSMPRGKYASMAVWDRSLSAEEVAKHYKASLISKPQTFKTLWAAEDTLWDSMLKIALADVGMFFFEEDDSFKYESALALYNDQYPEHTENQYIMNEDEDIIAGSQSIELLINKVIVNVYPAQSTTNPTQNIWSADSSESLAATTLTVSLDASEVDSISFDAEVNDAGILEPIFPQTGLIRIGDEIIEYTSADDFHLYGLTRGMFNTTQGSYSAGEFIGEAREYNLQWSDSPVIMVKYPFITAQIFDGTVDVNLWNSNPTSGRLIISLNPSFDPDNIYQVLQGTNPLTGLDNAFVIAGIPAINNDSKGSTSQVSSDYAQNIRRYGLKDITIDNQFIQDAAYAKIMADFVLLHNSSPVKVISIQSMGIPHLQLGDRINIDEFDQLSINDIDYWIMGIEIQYDGGISQSLSLKQVD